MNTDNHDSYVTVSHGGAGYFAVLVWWNPEGFWEPMQTGIGRYSLHGQAAEEGKHWAEAEGLEFRA